MNKQKQQQNLQQRTSDPSRSPTSADDELVEARGLRVTSSLLIRPLEHNNRCTVKEMKMQVTFIIMVTNVVGESAVSLKFDCNVVPSRYYNM